MVGLAALTVELDEILDLAGVLIGSAAIGSGGGITTAILDKRSLKTAELWGFRGAAGGFALGLFLVICLLAARA